jgi:arylsulfatase A-like enzyme/Flp pilus assembly protein TadD
MIESARQVLDGVRGLFRRSVRVRLQISCLVGLSLGNAFAATKPPAKKTPVNVILITIDTVRADHLGSYGYTSIQTPTLDALGHDGVVFERATSQVPLTWPSHAAILTGLYPFQNGVQDFTGQPLDKRFRSVAEAFKDHGYATGAVVSAFVLDRSWGLARGFDFYDDAFSPQEFANRDLGLVERHAGESVDHALSWLGKNSRRPFFFWLHLYDPHSPYDPPEPYHSQYQGHLYDGEIAYADHELGRVVDWLKRSRLYDRSLILFVSDHGESLGEHGEHEHGFFVYNSTVHIPLIVKPPTGSGIRPARISRPVETIDVAATLMEVAGLHDSLRGQAHSKGLFAATESDGAAYSETFYPFSSFGWNPLHALETNRYHFIDAPQAELYDVLADPDEKENIASQQPATAAVLKEKLQALLRDRPYQPSAGGDAGLSSDALDKLRSLGYVAYRSPVSAGALAAGLPDPKTKLWEFNSILQSEDAMRAGDTEKGKALLLEVREKDPEMYVVPFVLGETALSQQKWDEAATELHRCLELNPHFDQAMLGLARALIFQGKADEARKWTQSAIQYNPENYRAWYQLAFIDSKSDKKTAIADDEKAVAIQSSFAPLQRDLGFLQYQEGDYAEAMKHLVRAVELGSSDADLFNALGICYSRTDRVPLAIKSYERALELDPKLAQAHLNLGFAYERANQKSLADREYEQACQLKAELCDAIEKHRQQRQ